MRKITSLFLSLLCIFTIVGCGENNVKNAEYNEYKSKALEVINFTKDSGTNSLKNRRLIKKTNNDVYSTLFDIINDDSSKQEIYFEDTYNQYSELSLKIPLTLGYAGNKYHKMDTFFDKVFMETAMTGSNQYVITTKVDENNYITKMVCDSYYGESHLNYISSENFSFEWMTFNPTSYELIAYYYGDSNENLIGFGEFFAGIHLSGHATGWTTTNKDTIDFFKNNINIEINEDDIKNTQLSLKNREHVTISDKEFSESLSAVLSKSLANNGVDPDGWRNLSKVDTVFGYEGSNCSTLVIPSKYTKLYYDFAINAKVKTLIIPKTVTSIVDDNGASVTPDEFVLRTNEYINDNYNNYYLEEIIVEEGSSLFSVKNGNLYTKDGKTLLYIIDSSKYTSLDLRCEKLGDGIDFETKRKYWNNIKDIIVDINTSFSLLNDYVRATNSFTTLDSLTIYNWNDSILIINDQFLDFSMFNIKVINIYGSFTEVMHSLPQGDYPQFNCYSSNEYRLSGTIYGVKEVIIDKDSNESLGMVYYPDLETIIVKENVKEVNLDYISTDKNLKVYMPSTIENVYGMPSTNGDRIVYVPSSYYWKNKLSEFPQIDYYYETNRIWKVELIESSSEEEKYIYESFKNVVSDGETLKIINYYGIDSSIKIPSSINGIKVTEVWFNNSLAEEYFMRYGEKVSTTFKDIYLPDTITSFSNFDNYHFEKIYYEGTREQFESLFGDNVFYDEVIYVNEIN